MKFPLFLMFGLALTGCAHVTPPLDHRTDNLLKKILAPTPAADIVSWVQPDNQASPCKLYMSWRAQTPYTLDKATWDGACQDGYAVGIGRETTVSSQGRGSAISRYAGGTKPPVTYCSTLAKPAAVVFGDDHGSLQLVEHTSVLEPVMSLSTRISDRQGNDWWSLFIPQNGETRLIKRFPSGYDVVYRYPAAPLDLLALEIRVYKNERPLGVAVRRFKNGAVQVARLKRAGAQSVRVSDEYTAFLNRTLVELLQKSDEALRNADASLANIAEYRQAHCSQAPCLDDAERKRLATALAKLDSERQQRFDKELQSPLVPQQWRDTMAHGDPATPLGDAVNQYQASEGITRVMARYLQ